MMQVYLVARSAPVHQLSIQLIDVCSDVSICASVDMKPTVVHGKLKKVMESASTNL